MDHQEPSTSHSNKNNHRRLNVRNVEWDHRDQQEISRNGGNSTNHDVPDEASNRTNDLWRKTVVRNYRRRNQSTSGLQDQQYSYGIVTDKKLTKTIIRWIMKRCFVSDKNTLKKSLSGFDLEVETIMDKSINDTIYCCVHLKKSNRNSKKCVASQCRVVSESMVLSQPDYTEFREIRGIKLMSHTMKAREKVIERRLREETENSQNQFGFMPGRGPTDDTQMRNTESFFDHEDHSPKAFNHKCEEDVDMPVRFYKCASYDAVDKCDEFMVKQNQVIKDEFFKRCPMPMELPDGYYSNHLKCSPRRSRIKKDYTKDDEKEEEVPHFIFVITLDKNYLCKCTSQTSAKFSSCCCSGLGRRMKKIFTSEDNLVQRMAWRGHVFYCTCLCVWYQVAEEYNKVSAGIHKMNRENR